MIEITIGSLEEKIIKLLQKTYPITTIEIAQKLRISRRETEWILKKFQVKGIVKLEPLPNITYVRLLRNDFQFIGSKQQRRIMKHTSKNKKEENENYDGIMYT
ncbi:MAG TPA: winged helix-turn-helix domain-containing protein [Candidatus Thermoplasmatota archaeon]|nr:winged helix-turn-helix domain-containing protein [Candidatus Thermoplasmatota archaeon]